MCLDATVNMTEDERELACGTTSYVFMEYFPTNLAQEVKELEKKGQKLGERQALFLLLQVFMILFCYLSPITSNFLLIFQMTKAALAIDHLNKNGLAHRDIKLNNFMVRPDSSQYYALRMIDFGCTTLFYSNVKLGNPGMWTPVNY
jgi:serine/threonine protein kinase